MDPVDDMARAFSQAIEQAKAELREEFTRKLAEVRQELAGADARPMSVRETCKRYGIGRSTFDRLLHDRVSGLEEVVLRVGGRVLVPRREFEAWARESKPRLVHVGRQGRREARG